MHTKKKGRSRSRKPLMESASNDSGLSKEQISELVEGYAKQGMGPALIGEKLKREHKVMYIRQATGQRLMTILKEKGMAGQIPPDMLQLMKKAVGIRAHLVKNNKDVHGKVRLGRVESKIWRLSKYYMRTGSLPKGWRYDPQQAELLIRGKA